MDNIIKSKCPICQHNNSAVMQNTGINLNEVTCDCCKVFLISDNCINITDVASKLKKIGYILSGLSRELHELGQEAPKFTVDTIEDYTHNNLIPDLESVEAKANKLLDAIKRRSPHFGSQVRLSIFSDTSLGYAYDSEELTALLKFLAARNLIELKHSLLPEVTLTAEAWNLKRKQNQQAKQAFIAIWFDDAVDPSIKAIKEAVQECGYSPLCLKGEHFSERIIDKALGEIRESRFVIVDLSDSRLSVFFEAGFATALGLDIIYIYQEDRIKEGTPQEFYVKHYQCNKYVTPEDLKSVLIDAIKARIK